jgi:diadenylate cyclase
MLVRDYLPESTPRRATTTLGKFGALGSDQLLDAAAVAVALGYPAKTDFDEHRVEARGFRQLHRIPLLPGTVINRLVERFGTLSALMEATEAQLDDVDGVGARRARAIYDGLRRMKERAVL